MSLLEEGPPTMPRLPSDNPATPRGGAYSEAMRQTVLQAREQAIRDFGEAEEADDRERAADARERIRKAQALIVQYGLDR